MTGGGKVTVPVEWAWQGKAPGDRGYRLLAHSTGDISAGNFAEILDRFVPGTLERLPQITVSYVPGGDSSGYLSMAFHEEAAGSLDRLGRDVTFTRFFCMPYRQLANGAVSYRAICQAFERRRLPDAPDAPFEVELSCPPATIPGDAARALPVIELLLTGNPVCILEAEATSMAERLAYIDTVMSLLPYGMRAEMAAATWTSRTYRKHRYRLFFSDTPRGAAESGFDDHLVRWRPDQMVITRASKTKVPGELGAEYRQWLQHVLEGPSITTELAQDTTARAFKADDVGQILDEILEKRKRSWIRLQKRRDVVTREIATRRDETLVAEVQREPWPAKGASPDPVENLLEGISRNLNSSAKGTQNILPYQNELQGALNRAWPSDESRALYRARIVSGSLLRDDLPIAKDKKAGFYRILLRAAFGEAISYLDYCEIERMLHGAVPDKPLLQAIDELISEDFQPDVRALFLVHYHLHKGKYQKSRFGPANFLEIAAHPDLREDHARLIWDVTIGAVRNARSAEIELHILPFLQRRGFLASELQQCIPADLDFQVSALKDLLEAVYRGRVHSNALPDILSGARGRYPTLALLLALCELIADENVGLMLFSFMCGLGESASVPESTRGRLAQLKYSRDLDDGYAEVAAITSEEGATRPIMSSSRTDAMELFNRIRPADPSKQKKGRFRRIVNPSGEFTVSDEKSRADDDR
jgi:hypothetical protein